MPCVEPCDTPRFPSTTRQDGEALSSPHVKAKARKCQTEMGYRPYSKVACRMALKFAKGTYSGTELLEETA